jgi:hypothetical protein
VIIVKQRVVINVLKPFVATVVWRCVIDVETTVMSIVDVMELAMVVM